MAMDAGGALAVVQVLAGAGLAGGAVGGVVAGLREPAGAAVRWHVAFLVYLGIVCCAASTWAGSLDIVPFALMFGAVCSIVPFAASFFALRYLVNLLRVRLHARACAKR
jgi:threonine/homoserine efflux transporter RhtA